MKVPILSLLFILVLINPSSALNTQGKALLKFKEKVLTDPFNALSNWTSQSDEPDPCSWFGVFCSNGNVVVLELKNLCLGGTLAAELGQLSFIKSIILRNNSFGGVIPSEIADLEQLEMLDLGYNNFSGPLPSNFGNSFSLSILLVDNNNLLGSLSPELNELQLLSEHQVDENQLRGDSNQISCNSEPVSWYTTPFTNFIRRSLVSMSKQSTVGIKGNTDRQVPGSSGHLKSPGHHPIHSHAHESKSPMSAPSHSHGHLPPSQSPSPTLSHSHVSQLSSPPLAPPPPHVEAAHAPLPSSISSKTSEGSTSKHHKVIIWAAIAGAMALLIIVVVAVLVCRSTIVVSVKPWATGLSGQLQRALVSGVPKLKRPELEVACEDFSNIIGSLDDGTVYKGTLSNGVEIAVVSSSLKCPEDWSKKLELQFRKKIDTLSKINHKNFVNLIGYCEEEKPFTRMMVFEYAPNGSLFEHLHIKEAERLDWGMRLRIIMGMTYCFEHMHQLDPPISHRDMQSSSIYLSEDYAAKVSDFSFWSKGTRTKMRSPSMRLLEASSTDTKENVYNFGVLLFEIITGRIPFMEDSSSVADWVLDMLQKGHIPRESIDPTLNSFLDEEVETLFYIIRDCVNPDAGERPSMHEVAARLREMTGMSPDGAIPKLSPLWWAELEVLSM